ncbi:hypothetical protein ACHAWF_006093 [Thalassiosira exigua]
MNMATVTKATIRLVRRAPIAVGAAPSTSSLPSTAGSYPRRLSSTEADGSGGRKKTKNVTAAAADRRLAGRRRFYDRVGIAPCSPPSREGRGGGGGDDAPGGGTVESPISAGVDGTRSATGVNTRISDAGRWASLLDPSFPSPSPRSSWHTVTLDGRALRTPLGLSLSLPSPLLALAVASEWDAQKKYLQPAQMPLMTLCCTAIDQVASDPAPHREDAMRYLANDTSCYWADPGEDRVLHRRQSTAWEGLHDELSAGLLGLPSDVGPAQATGGGEALILSRKSGGNPRSGLPHPPVLVDKARGWVDSLDAWTLAAFYSACSESKSFFIGAGLVRDALTAGEEVTARAEAAGAGGGGRGNEAVRCGKWAADASRIEEEFNIECWGLVEGGHDYDRLNCSIQMHAASFLARTVAASRKILPASDLVS